MAVVYEATELATGERVALKMMSHRLVYQPGAFSRFEREARIVESLEHDNIARLKGHFPAFRTEFIVMEFCEGSTLAELLSRHGAFPKSRPSAFWASSPRRSSSSTTAASCIAISSRATSC